MPKILFVSNTANFQKFNLPFMRDLRDKGWQVDYASPADEPVTECDNFVSLDMPRSPFHVLKILRAIKILRRHLEKSGYDIIHCHTPVGSVVARLAARKLWGQKRIKVIYTAHGFHFYKGAPLLNWLVYYPVEKMLSRCTDVLITINEEDYQLAKRRFHAKEILKIDGVGVDLEKFAPLEEKHG